MYISPSRKTPEEGEKRWLSRQVSIHTLGKERRTGRDREGGHRGG